MDDTYVYLHLRGPGRDASALTARLESALRPAWQDAGLSVWGVWQGLFGVASNELLVMLSGTGRQPLAAFTGPLGSLEVRQQLLLTPTVRPADARPCTSSGLYVFRFFSVRTRDVAEIARLSNEAWTTFEDADAYRAEPQGLFRERDSDRPEGTMLLVTWYDGLESWQVSRRPAPAATENFQRRRALTLGTMALATRLLED